MDISDYPGDINMAITKTFNIWILDVDGTERILGVKNSYKRKMKEDFE